MTLLQVFETDYATGGASPDYLPFQLYEHFIERYRRIPAPFGSTLGEATFWRTYSRDDNPRLPFEPLCLENACTCLADKRVDDEGNIIHRHLMESWVDVCRRVIEGMHSLEMEHCLANGINWNPEKAMRAAEEAFDLMFHFKWTPPGRGLSFMGTAFVHKDREVEVLQNCAFVPTHPSESGADVSLPYYTLMNWSMLGVGVGFDTGGKSMRVHRPDSREPVIRVIGDSREEWAASTAELVASYLMPGQSALQMDYSQIRPKGARIRRFGGTASGPEALMVCHDRIREVLDERIGKRIGSRGIVDAMNIIGVAVVSGNARRSAELALGDEGDDEFIHLKTPEMMAERPENWMSNNSVIMKPSQGTDYREISKLIWETGEPGVYWLDNVHNYGRMNKIMDRSDGRVTGANPCMEQELEPWEMCTLTEIFAPNIRPEERRVVVKHAYRYAKIVTIVNRQIRHDLARPVMSRNMRIGLSQTGVAQVYEQYGEAHLVSMLSEMYDYVQRYDALYSQWYGVPRSIRTTSVKPSGTVSTLANVTPGAHFSVAGEYYWRRVNMPMNGLLAGHLAGLGYPMEPSVYSENTVVVSFPERLPFDVRSELDVPLGEQLRLAYILARYWADNMVSFTAKFLKERTTPEDIESFLKEAQHMLKGVSLLPVDNGVYAQMPYEPMKGGKAEYDRALARIPVPFHISGNPVGLHEVDDKFCEGSACEIRTYQNGG